MKFGNIFLIMWALIIYINLKFFKVGIFNLNNCNYNIHINMNIKKKLFNIDNHFKI